MVEGAWKSSDESCEVLLLSFGSSGLEDVLSLARRTPSIMRANAEAKLLLASAHFLNIFIQVPFIVLSIQEGAYKRYDEVLFFYKDQQY